VAVVDLHLLLVKVMLEEVHQDLFRMLPVAVEGQVVLE
jgi:hypothetical protein